MTNSTNYMLEKMNGEKVSAKNTETNPVLKASEEVNTPDKELSLPNLLAKCLTRKDSFDHRP
ncbi:hypothetical protein [Legionella cardiaca]|uniref:Uncharacterized protein n=1 Tax=Legionella cardiaca TaxID=1071983 RepID=A0ABY8ATU6_9GAMM|nr:hypothetical protein [Legionella cardiaca]WED43616.1 hypothetical protein PXX05_02235 [Legionella cardiaca]